MFHLKVQVFFFCPYPFDFWKKKNLSRRLKEARAIQVKKRKCFIKVVNNIKLANSNELCSISALYQCCSSDTVPTITFLSFLGQAWLNSVKWNKTGQNRKMGKFIMIITRAIVISLNVNILTNLFWPNISWLQSCKYHSQKIHRFESF